MDILFHELHIPRKTGLAFAKDDLEFFRPGSFNHAVEIGTLTVYSREVFITKNGVDIPIMVNCVTGQ